MKTKSVVVVPYDAQWKQDFETISLELKKVLGNLTMKIEHVGSTSVEGLPAKPIIDIDIVIENNSVFAAVVAALGQIGYRHEGDLGIKGREAFCYEGKEHLRKHHLYVCQKDSAELHRHLVFRNYLRAHPEAVKKYGQIKQEAAKRFPNSIDEYIAYKAAYIEELYRHCGLI